MHSDNVYILHKQGANGHYVALNFLLQKKGSTLKYREFSVLSKAFKSVRKGNFKLLVKQFVNFGFLVGLLFTKNKKIVVGIAPFDYKLGFLLKFLEHHKVYYHTSWACWDKSFHPKRKNNSPKVYKKWKYFLEQKTEFIFCVTEKSKNQLLKNYVIDSPKIEVVFHALDPVFSSKPSAPKIGKSFIYYGRLVPQKGIEELLTYFSKNKELSLTLIGSGKQQQLTERYASKCENIIYINQIADKIQLKEVLAKHQFLILNSKKNTKWEELFGLVIIESMSQGVIPISTNHSGPKEIITPETGFLYEENDLNSIFSIVLEKNYEEVEKMSKNTISKSKSFLPGNIAERWKAIL